jgi:hypothetical protein
LLRVTACRTVAIPYVDMVKGEASVEPEAYEKE